MPVPLLETCAAAWAPQPLPRSGTPAGAVWVVYLAVGILYRHGTGTIRQYVGCSEAVELRTYMYILRNPGVTT